MLHTTLRFIESMEVRFDGKDWFGKKNKKAVRWERITDLIKFDGDFASVMGKAGRTTFHSYLGKSNGRWLEMYGVTSLLEYWGTKENLLQWAVNQACDHIKENAEVWENTDGTEPEYSLTPEVLEEARSAHLSSLKKAGDHGTDKHALVEQYVLDQIAGKEGTYEGLEDFIQWSDMNNVTFLASEMAVSSRRLWCAGTMDIFGEIDGKKFIMDVKTSNYVSYKNFVQCGAYALMLEEMTDEKVEGIAILHMPRSGGFNVHLDMDVDGYKKDFESLVQLVKRDKDKSYQLYS